MSSNQKSLLVRSERAPISVTVAGAVLVLGAIMFSCKAIMVKLSLPYGIDPVSLLALRMIFAVPAYVEPSVAGLRLCFHDDDFFHGDSIVFDLDWNQANWSQ